MRLRTIAIIVAEPGPGGPDEAAGPGMLASLAGQPVIGHSVAAFEASPLIDEIIVIAAAGVRALLAGRGYRKVSRVLDPGRSRAESVRQALQSLGPAEVNVLIHDARRALVGQRIIEDCVTALRARQAVCTAVPASDTMVAVENELVTLRPARDRLRRRQTPQGFRLSVIRRGYELALADQGAGPAYAGPADDCGIVLRYLPEVTVGLARGSELNFAITRPADIGIAETMLRAELP
ncbi:MAG TPA: 2-C-methyl-D-erythritol 4-phosphate cytidylyltransferase [Streptosporangiaceae bacterium]|jgi:2-C-methyl-D-erythritol 4-phosphate cytidylyltransferase